MKPTEMNLVDRMNRPPLKPMQLVVRPGATNMLKHPSKMGNTLYYSEVIFDRIKPQK
jgi:hypothetical protein